MRAKQSVGDEGERNRTRWRKNTNEKTVLFRYRNNLISSVATGKPDEVTTPDFLRWIYEAEARGGNIKPDVSSQLHGVPVGD